jgi:hypothetical protein
MSQLMAQKMAGNDKKTARKNGGKMKKNAAKKMTQNRANKNGGNCRTNGGKRRKSC